MKVNIGNWPKNHKLSRKIDIKIEKFDTWNLDTTLAKIIYPALLQLKETKHGIPNDFSVVGGEDYAEQDSFDFYKETYSESFDEVCNRWNDTLDKMIWAFQQLAEGDYSSQYHHGKMEVDWKETDKLYPNPVTGKMEKTYTLIDKNPNEHWYDSIGHQLHEERIQEGIELFGKYYRSLWD